jgi:Na+/serine symporter
MMQDTKFCDLTRRSFVSQVITGYLPSLILQLFLKAVAPIMVFLSSIQGYISHSMIEKSACKKVLWFTIWNIFFATAFSGSIFYQVSIFLDPKKIPAKLAVAVPAQVSVLLKSYYKIFNLLRERSVCVFGSRET